MAALGNVLIQDVILTYKGVKIYFHSDRIVSKTKQTIIGGVGNWNTTGLKDASLINGFRVGGEMRTGIY
jgi:hypothetical protein